MSTMLPGYLQRATTGLMLLRPTPGQVDVVDVNRAAATLLDNQPGEIAGRPLGDCSSLRDVAEVSDAARRIADGGSPRWQTEVDLATSGRRRAEITLTPAGDLGDGLVLAQVTDRTRERQLREQLAQSRRITRGSLEEAISGYLSAASHELRTPLSSVVGCTEVLLEGSAGGLTEAQHDLLTSVDRNGRRLQSLVVDLLGLAAADAESLVMEREGVTLRGVVDRTLTAIDPAMSGRGVDAQVHCADPGPVVRGDRPQLDRLAHHLVSHALASTPDGGRITVDLGHDGTDCVMVVTASGPGTPPAGLGLSVARSIAAAHGGSLAHAATDNGGSTLTVRLVSA
ncbi:PAS domain-containing sensor histidine kinase [Nocardioides euryhalodurans]|uniref:histidine kinase n=1 Tax=Nocardioides euryhalodurans TaxID=2518370 RepID=A0A4V1BDL4_9ACTN|nr:PAS domain-containing sensor histidine kinase [Nocardioides euryhalodurans]QBR91532.1 PAS domain-containing sensor histidine kinase [Nocardioides euryhalodurans]